MTQKQFLLKLQRDLKAQGYPVKVSGTGSGYVHLAPTDGDSSVSFWIRPANLASHNQRDHLIQIQIEGATVERGRSVVRAKTFKVKELSDKVAGPIVQHLVQILEVRRQYQARVDAKTNQEQAWKGIRDRILKNFKPSSRAVLSGILSCSESGLRVEIDTQNHGLVTTLLVEYDLWVRNKKEPA